MHGEQKNIFPLIVHFVAEIYTCVRTGLLVFQLLFGVLFTSVSTGAFD